MKTTLKQIFLIEADTVSSTVDQLFKLAAQKFDIKAHQAPYIMPLVVILSLNDAKRKAFYNKYYTDASFREQLFNSIIYSEDSEESGLFLFNATQYVQYVDSVGTDVCVVNYDKMGGGDMHLTTFSVKHFKTIVNAASTYNELIVLINRVMKR